MAAAVVVRVERSLPEVQPQIAETLRWTAQTAALRAPQESAPFSLMIAAAASASVQLQEAAYEKRQPQGHAAAAAAAEQLAVAKSVTGAELVEALLQEAASSHQQEV